VPRVDLDVVTAALAKRPSLVIDGPDVDRRAAVSTILRRADADLEVLLIRRAERVGDPWSGHMAFPGGGREARDTDLQATAVRETCEEVGLRLHDHGRLIGRLDDVRATARGTVTGLVVTPFVFELLGTPTLGTSDEVAEIHWAPLGPMLAGERDATIDYVWQGQTLKLPGFRLDASGEPRIVWGLTHKMLTMFFSRLREGAV
jgi:8-oxo-dGTP pyrophosphatase MutT (NUDIX family)